jgi:hypothetical protein
VETQVYMVGMGGEPVWSRHYTSGDTGAQAGTNAIKFNGISDLTGKPLGNGIYVYKIISNGQVLGKGYVVVYQ